MQQNGGFRKVPFTMVSNEALHCKTLSIRAKGLYALIQSFITIPGFSLNKNYLMKISGLGKSALDNALKELKTQGFLKITQKREKNGFVYKYELLETANTETPAMRTVRLSGEIIPQNENLNPNIGSECTALKMNINQKTSNINNNYKNNIDVNNNQSVKDRKIDVDELQKEIVREKGIPCKYANDVEMMENIIHLITEWNTFYPNGFNSGIRQQTYELINVCLLEMTTEKEIKKYNNLAISNIDVIAEINKNLLFYNDNTVLLDNDFIEVIMNNYITALETRGIKSPVSYMKSILWNGFKIYKIQSYESTFDFLGRSD